MVGNLRGASAEASMQKRKCTLGRSVPAIALAIVLGTAAGVLATCGDGVLDPDEQCDHGAANGQDDCCSVVCELIDMDYDGTCDALTIFQQARYCAFHEDINAQMNAPVLQRANHLEACAIADVT